MNSTSVSLLPFQYAHSDSRFTILKSTIKGSGGELQVNEIIDLCLSYVPSTTFSSIPMFLRYFQERDVLPLSAGQPLKIDDPSFFFHLQTEYPEILPADMGQKLLFLLDKIIALVGKRGIFKGKGLASSVKVSPDLFSIEFASDFTLQAQRETVTIRPAHLFRMMDAFCVPYISFAPDQTLIFVGITEEEQQFETPADVNLKKWVRYAPKDCEINWHIKEGGYSYSSGTQRGWFGITQPQRIFYIEALKGMTLSLTRPLSIVSVHNPLRAVSVVRINKEMALKENFVFYDKNAIVVIEHKLTGLGKKVLIVAKNVIMSPNARMDVGELHVQTEGAALLLNVKADVIRLEAKGDAILGNSSINLTRVKSDKNALVFGDEQTTIPFTDHYAAIVSVLQDAIPLDIRLQRSLQVQQQSSAVLLKAPEVQKPADTKK